MRETLIAGVSVALFVHLMAAKLIQITPTTPAEGAPLQAVTTVALITASPAKETAPLPHLPKRPEIQPQLIKRRSTALYDWIALDDHPSPPSEKGKETLFATAYINGRTGEILSLRSEDKRPIDWEEERRKRRFPPDPLGTFYELLIPIEVTYFSP